MALALLVSLLSHLLLLSLTFGGDKQGLPGFIAPWRDRRIEVPDLRIVLVPAPVSPAEPPQRVTINAPVAGGPASALPESQAPSPPVTAVPAVTGAPAAETTARADATPDAVAIVARVEAPAPPARPDLAAPVQTPEPAGVAAGPSDAPSPIVLAAPLSPTFVIAAAPSASSPQTVLPEFQGPGDAAQQAQREQAARQEAARVEAVRQEAERQEAARQESARQAAARLEDQRRETARQEAARVQAEKDETAKRDAVLRAIGRQLDEEAAQRDAAKAVARPPNPLPYSLSTARRVRLWGRSDPNV